MVKGVANVWVPVEDIGRVAAFKDSEGNDLQLYEPPSG